MTRREFLSAVVVSPVTAASSKPPVKLGIDLFSIRSSNWSPFEALDYCARLGVQLVHFSEIRFLGSLEESHVRKVAEHARRLGLELEIGMGSICPSSKRFQPEGGPAEKQLAEMIRAAEIAGSKIVRAYLGSWEDRSGPLPIEAHIENTVKVLKAVRSRALNAGIQIAIENHAGDMQARELKMLVEQAGTDFVGVCLDSGNPLWAIEDPHHTLRVLAPYTLTSHVRDSLVWRTPKGVAVRWVRAGEGNVDLAGWIREYLRLCPGRPLTLEVIVTGPRELPFLEPEFWEAYPRVPAAEFARFLAIAERGQPAPYTPPTPEQRAQREREDLEASLRWVKQLLGV